MPSGHAFHGALIDMFATTFIQWLQGFDAPWLLAAMGGLSTLGTSTVYMLAFIVLAFGIRLKPMLGVLLAMAIAGAATSAIKQGFALPRPSEIDARVLDKGESGHHIVADGAATRFWALPDHQAVAAVRATKTQDFGFISGHASAATAFAIGLVLWFGLRTRRAWALALGWAFAIGLSRLYLGRHFPADVLGGWLVGGLAVAAGWCFTRAIEHPERDRRRIAWAAASTWVAALFAVSLHVPWLAPGSVGEISGALVSIALLPLLGAARERHWALRALCVVIAIASIHGVDAAVSHVWQAGGWHDRHPLGFLFAMLGYPLAILGTAWLTQRVGRKPDRVVASVAGATTRG
jgi:membrane-associated phospholipid phosphatase